MTKSSHFGVTSGHFFVSTRIEMILPKNTSTLLALVAGGVALVLFLNGCEVPVLNSLSPDTSNQGSQNVQVTLTGNFFEQQSKLVIDGSVDGTGPDIVLANLQLVDQQHLNAFLNIDANASPGAHSIAVGNPSAGISDPKYFYVSRATCSPSPSPCPLPPRVHGWNEPEPVRVLRGAEYRLEIEGENFGNNPGIELSGMGVTASPFYADPTMIHFSVDVAPDAPTGTRELRVITDGGISNPVYITILAAPLPVPWIFDVTVAGSTLPHCLHTGSNTLDVSGFNFDVFTDIIINLTVDGVGRQLIGSNTVLIDSGHIRTHLEITSTPPVEFQARPVNVFGDYGNEPTFYCGIVLSAIEPATLIKAPPPSYSGFVFLTFLGGGFHNFPESHPTVRNSLGTLQLLRTYTSNDPNRKLVALFQISYDNFSRSDLLRIEDTFNGELSNELDVNLNAAGPGDPYVTSLLSVTQGQQGNTSLSGVNLQGVTDASWENIPSIHFTNTNVNASGTSVSFHFRVDPHAPLSEDWCQNARLTTSDNKRSNEFAIEINPAPTPTPTPTPTATPVLSDVTPTSVNRGQTIFIKCSGNNFSNGGNARVVVTTPNVTGFSYPTVRANPTNVAVARLDIPTNAPDQIAVQVKDTTTNVSSNTRFIHVFDPPPAQPPDSVPYITAISPSVRQGTTVTCETANGSYNLNHSQFSNWSWSSAPGGLSSSDITFANTNYTSPPEKLTFSVTVAPGAPVTGDAATNIMLSIGGLGGGPVGLEITP